MTRFMLAVALAATVAAAFVSSASADVQRYQTQTATLTAVANGAYVHIYGITINPCDGSFTGLAAAGSVVAGEAVTGTLGASYLTIDVDGLYPSTYAWSYSGPLTGGVGHGPGGQTFDVAFTLTNLTTSSTWKNHGQYVKAMGGGPVAARSCLGKPIPFSWSQSGTIAPTLAGAAVVLPIAGVYRIDVTGTWTNGGHGWVDAEFTDDGAGGSQDGFPGIGADFGDLMVGGAFVNWGAFNAGHAYSYTGTFASGELSFNLAVFDGSGGVPTPGWYGDNTGSLAYTITFVGE